MTVENKLKYILIRLTEIEEAVLKLLSSYVSSSPKNGTKKNEQKKEVRMKNSGINK
jgi:hypothetical protein